MSTRKDPIDNAVIAITFAYGSQEQEDAQNAFCQSVKETLGSKAWAEFEDWISESRADGVEIVMEGLRLTTTLEL